jgi:hypothetical protein
MSDVIWVAVITGSVTLQSQSIFESLGDVTCKTAS